MKLRLVPASAGRSYRLQRLINELHGIGELLCFCESLGQEVASELHPDQRTRRFQRPHAPAKLGKALFHIPEIAACPAAQHAAARNASALQRLCGCCSCSASCTAAWPDANPRSISPSSVDASAR